MTHTSPNNGPIEGFRFARSGACYLLLLPHPTLLPIPLYIRFHLALPANMLYPRAPELFPALRTDFHAREEFMASSWNGHVASPKGARFPRVLSNDSSRRYATYDRRSTYSNSPTAHDGLDSTWRHRQPFGLHRLLYRHRTSFVGHVGWTC